MSRCECNVKEVYKTDLQGFMLLSRNDILFILVERLR